MGTDILVLDGDTESRDRIVDSLVQAGYTPRPASDPDSAVAAVDARVPHAALVDMGLTSHQGDSIEVLRWLADGRTCVPVIALVAPAARQAEAAALGAGAYHVLEKIQAADWAPFIMAQALECARLKRENADLLRLAGGPPSLVGHSGAIQQVRSAIERVAPTGSRVLIAGASGSGKEIVARLLHQRSQRQNGPFALVNCAAHNAASLEAAIFGTARSDNGTGERQIGAAEQAHGGTLVLDEIAAIPLPVQQKLLRLLQEQAFERVGGRERVAVDVRVIATSARDLNQAIAAGQFRQALYYRLNVVPIRVPPLAERREDIPLLARHLMARAAASLGMAPRTLAEDAIAALQAYHWPGNVRQLRTAIEWMLIADGSEPLSADSLPPEVRQEVAGEMPVDSGSAEMMGLPLREAREVFERHYLLTHLTRFGGDISKTASFVGMERTALHRKLKTLGVANAERLS